MSISPVSDHLSDLELRNTDLVLSRSTSNQEEAVEKSESMEEVGLVDMISTYAKSFFYFLYYQVPVGCLFAIKKVILFPFSALVYSAKQITQLFWQESALEEKSQSEKVKELGIELQKEVDEILTGGAMEPKSPSTTTPIEEIKLQDDVKLPKVDELQSGISTLKQESSAEIKALNKELQDLNKNLENRKIALKTINNAFISCIVGLTKELMNRIEKDSL